MGMYDYLKCEYPLPDGFQWEGRWQTKDLDCTLGEYLIDRDGNLIQTTENYPRPIGPLNDFHGEIVFYNSNVRGGGAGHYYTEKDEPLWSHTYHAKFTKGKLIEITGGADKAFHDAKHVTQADFDKIVSPLIEEGYMKGAKKKHDQAMKLADQADHCQDRKERLCLYAEAGSLEQQAAQWSNDPSRTILFNSAVRLYICAEDLGSALQCVESWLMFRKYSNPPRDYVNLIADAVRDIAATIQEA